MIQTAIRNSRARLFGCVALIGVVHSHAFAQTSIPQRQLREELRIVSNDNSANMMLTPVDNAILMPDGRVITVHRKEAVLRVFDANGKFVRMVGRKGQGPGEFQSPGHGGYVGEMLWIYDGGRRRVLTFGADYAPQVDVTQPADPGRGLAIYGLASGTTSVAGIFDDIQRIAIFDRDGRLVRPLNINIRHAPAYFEVNDVVLDPSGSRVTGVGPTIKRNISHPLTAHTIMGIVPGGQTLLVLESAEIWGGKPGQLHLRRVTAATAKTSPELTVTLPPRKVSSGERDSLIAATVKRESRVADQVKAKAHVPEYFPAFRDFLPSSDGVVWLEEPGLPNARVVIDLDGKILMRVTLPKGLRLFAVSRTTAWGLLKDANDLPIIVRYTVVP